MISDDVLRVLATKLNSLQMCAQCRGASHEGGGCPNCCGKSAPRNWDLPFEEMREIVNELMTKRGFEIETSNIYDKCKRCDYTRDAHCFGNPYACRAFEGRMT